MSSMSPMSKWSGDCLELDDWSIKYANFPIPASRGQWQGLVNQRHWWLQSEPLVFGTTKVPRIWAFSNLWASCWGFLLVFCLSLCGTSRVYGTCQGCWLPATSPTSLFFLFFFATSTQTVWYHCITCCLWNLKYLCRHPLCLFSRANPGILGM